MNKVISISTNWKNIKIGACVFYSPTPQLLSLIERGELSGQWWNNYYHEFALLIVDFQTGKIRAIRDHNGQEPFFYYKDNDKLIVASTIPEIISHLDKVPQINEQQIINTLLESYILQGVYSDETHYKGIFRVEPGSLIEFTSSKITKTLFWQLSTEPQVIMYQNEQDYLERFSELLNEGIKTMLPPDNMIVAAEFSGGLDSSAVVSALLQNNVTPSLFIHTAPDNSKEVDDSSNAEEVIKCYNLTNVIKVGAEEFNLQQVVEDCSKLFAGMPHFLFPVGANNIHQEVVKNGHKVLFSGFGGDECVSGHAPLSLVLREYLQKGDYRLARQELLANYRPNNKKSPNQFWQLIQLTKAQFPSIDNCLNHLRKLPLVINHLQQNIKLNSKHSFTSVAEAEAATITGRYSRHMRMRIEDSSIVAKAIGFSYRYPLLYPPLLEYCHSLPINLKRSNGVNRLLFRRYLAQYLPPAVYQKHQKVGGIMPATMEKIKNEYRIGYYQKLFRTIAKNKQLDWMLEFNNNNIQAQLIQQIFRYMQCFYVQNRNNLRESVIW